jgi:hypothetical protein
MQQEVPHQRYLMQLEIHVILVTVMLQKAELIHYNVAREKYSCAFSIYIQYMYTHLGF